jgi:argonaute-like protein implicated in RNA metabolism and viral defense
VTVSSYSEPRRVRVRARFRLWTGPKLTPIFGIDDDIVNCMQRIGMEKRDEISLRLGFVVEEEIFKFKKLGHCYLDWKGSCNFSLSQTSLAPSCTAPLRRSTCKTAWNLIEVLNAIT